MDYDITELKKLANKISPKNSIEKNDKIVYQIGGFLSNYRKKINGGATLASTDKYKKMIDKENLNKNVPLFKPGTIKNKKLEIQLAEYSSRIFEKYYLKDKDMNATPILVQHPDFDVTDDNIYTNIKTEYLKNKYPTVAEDEGLKQFGKDLSVWLKRFEKPASSLSRKMARQIKTDIDTTFRYKYNQFDKHNKKYKELLKNVLIKIPSGLQVDALDIAQSSAPFVLVSNDESPFFGKIKYSMGDLFRFMNMKDGVVPESVDKLRDIKYNLMMKMLKRNNPANLHEKISLMIAFLKSMEVMNEKKLRIHQVVKKLTNEFVNQREDPTGIFRGLDINDTPLSKFHDSLFNPWE